MQSRREQPSTYVLQQITSDEIRRLDLLDQATTASMGGVLPEQADSRSLEHVLDVGCGTGGWLIELARQHPETTMLIGVDASRVLVEHARLRAQEAGVADRVEFHVADALRMLEVPEKYFDLVNHRFAWSWLRTWDWPKLLKEYQRVCRRDGLVRITEGGLYLAPMFPAFTQLGKLFGKAMYASGHSFTEESDNAIEGAVPDLLLRHGLLDVQQRRYHFEERPGRDDVFLEHVRISHKYISSFIQRWVSLPQDHDQLYAQLLTEMRQPDFVMFWNVVTAWGRSAGGGVHPSR